MRFAIILFFAAVVSALHGAVETKKNARPEALVLVIGDQHSAYERTAQLIAVIDQLKASHPALPLAILINGDAFEYGNAVAKRSAGLVDFAMFSALAFRAPTILNLGNHEPEFYDVAETIRRIQATGVTVISNAMNRTTGELFVPASTQLKLGDTEATVVGLTTDHLATYRQAVRPSLDLADPVVWAKHKIPALLALAPVSVVMSHAGLNADREILPLVPEGTLFAGAHDHLRFVHPLGHGVYVHSGSWNEYLTLAWLRRDSTGAPEWNVEQIVIPSDGPADGEMAELIRQTRLKYLTPTDTVIVGKSAAAKSPRDAALFVTRMLRTSTGVDATFIGNTTFGAGLPAGAISSVEFDACVRFDGMVFTAVVDGSRLQALLADANQGPDVPFEKRRGEYLVAVGPEQIDPAKSYRIATTDWSARNSKSYFGEPVIAWEELPGLKIKARVLAGIK